MCISISQIGLISKIPGLAKHELLNVQKIYRSRQVFNSFVLKFYCVILNTYKLKFAKCIPPPLKSTFPGWASGKFVLTCCPRRRQCWVEEVRWEDCLWHCQDHLRNEVDYSVDGRCRQNQTCRGRSRGLQKRPAEQDPGLTASPAALWRLLHFFPLLLCPGLPALMTVCFSPVPRSTWVSSVLHLLHRFTSPEILTTERSLLGGSVSLSVKWG